MSHRALLHVFPTLAVGGSQVRFARIATTMGRSFAHSVLALDGRYDALGLIDQSVVEIATPKLDHKIGLAARLAACRRFIANSGCDMLVTYNWGSIEWALANMSLAWRGLPHIHFEDGFGVEEADQQINRRAWIRRVALQRSEAVVVASRALESIALSSWKLPATSVRHIRNGVIMPPITERRPGDRNHLGISESACVVGWIGGLRPEKNVPRLIAALKHLPDDVYLVLAGDGSERTQIEEEVRRSGLDDRVKLLGYRPDATDLLPSFDIFALASDTEQMPLVILEAMAAGLPAVSTDVGDVREMVSPENLPYVVGRSTEAIALAIKRLADDPGLRRTIGQANRNHVARHFSYEAMVSAYRALFGGRKELSLAGRQ